MCGVAASRMERVYLISVICLFYLCHVINNIVQCPHMFAQLPVDLQQLCFVMLAPGALLNKTDPFFIFLADVNFLKSGEFCQV